jgi:hypothetical protein
MEYTSGIVDIQKNYRTHTAVIMRPEAVNFSPAMSTVAVVP